MNKWEEEFVDTYTINWDDFLQEKQGLVFDNHNITKLFYDFIKGGKVKIKAREGVILIERNDENEF